MAILNKPVSDKWMIGAVALITLVALLIGEKIPINNGLGWDGRIYGTIAKQGPFGLTDFSVDQYELRRILPSLLVHYALRIVGLSLTDRNVIYGFGLLNVCCLTCIAWLWVEIAQMLGIGVRGKWTGFCGLFLNFVVLKHTSYYPVLTDIPAYAIGCGMLLLYLRNSIWGLLLLTATGAFVWAPLLPQGIILFLFPRKELRSDGNARKETEPANYLIAGFAAYCALLAICWSLCHANLPLYGYIDPVRFVLPLSLTIVAAYLYLATVCLLDFRQAAEAQRELLLQHWLRLVVVVGFVVALRIAYVYLAPDEGRLSGKLYLLLLGIKSVNKPGIFLVGHAVYFGPIVFLAIILWPEVSGAIKRVGFGLVLAVLVSLVQGLDGESRHLIHAFPLMVPFVVQVIERQSWTRTQYAAFVVVSLAASKVWFTINGEGFGSNPNLMEFPLQRYAMNHGVVMNNETYLIQGGLALAIAVAFWRFGARPRYPAWMVALSRARRSVGRLSVAQQWPRPVLALALVGATLSVIILSAVAVKTVRIGFTPLAGDDVAVAAQDQPLQINVLMNDADPTSRLDLNSIEIVEAPNSGRMAPASGIGVVTYVPNRGFVGRDFFRYTVRNLEGMRSNPARVNITVTP